jgi:hypothetical protein
MTLLRFIEFGALVAAAAVALALGAIAACVGFALEALEHWTPKFHGPHVRIVYRRSR